jgi:DNA-binding winged helix-turn-helix (wHTH) protein
LEKPQRHFDIAGITFDPGTGRLTISSRSTKLEPRAADVLALLCSEQGQLVSRQHLLDTCWTAESGTDEGLTQAIAQIRRALETLGAPREIITTYPKRGYRLTAVGSASRNDDRSSRSLAPRIAIGLLIAAAVAVLAFAPHWPRHLIRHALGLGPNHMQHP